MSARRAIPSRANFRTETENAKMKVGAGIPADHAGAGGRADMIAAAALATPERIRQVLTSRESVGVDEFPLLPRAPDSRQADMPADVLRG